MEVKTISVELFEKIQGFRRRKYIPQTGSLDGTYEDLLNYLSWSLESNETKGLMDSIKILNEKFNMPYVTTQFLIKNLSNKDRINKTLHIRYLLNKSDLTTINTLKYTNVRSQILDKVVNKKELEENNARILSEYLEKKSKEVKKVEVEEPIVDNTTYIELNCKRCSKNIKIPTMPNIETDKTQEFIWSIYSTKMEDINAGVTFCPDCNAEIEREGIWRKEKILSFVEEHRNEIIALNKKEFYKEFRNDNKTIMDEYLVNMLDRLNLPMEVKIKGSEILLLIH